MTVQVSTPYPTLPPAGGPVPETHLSAAADSSGIGLFELPAAAGRLLSEISYAATIRASAVREASYARADADHSQSACGRGGQAKTRFKRAPNLLELKSRVFQFEVIACQMEEVFDQLSAVADPSLRVPHALCNYDPPRDIRAVFTTGDGASQFRIVLAYAAGVRDRLIAWVPDLKAELAGSPATGAWHDRYPSPPARRAARQDVADLPRRGGRPTRT